MTRGTAFYDGLGSDVCVFKRVIIARHDCTPQAGDVGGGRRRFAIKQRRPSSHLVPGITVPEAFGGHW